jgi:P pilus assembly chaperone PapD
LLKKLVIFNLEFLGTLWARGFITLKPHNYHKLSLILLIFLSKIAFGYSLAPMNLTLDPSGRNATASFYLENKTDEPVPVEASIVKRSLDINGKETLEPLPQSENHFVIYPPMLTLKPHEKRTVRVAYKGPDKFPVEKTYRFFASQLPLSNYLKERNKNLLNILMRYGASLYVTPIEAEAKVSIVSSKVMKTTNTDKKTKYEMELIFENTGDVHKNLINYNIKFKEVNKLNTYTLEWKDVSKQVGPLNVFAKQKRRVLIPWVQGMPTTNIKSELEFLE